MGEEIKIPAKDGSSFMAYMAKPSRLPAPVVIVIQEIFGVNQGLRDKCDWLASEGFIAVCPDLFWRLEPGIQLTDKSDAEWKKAFDLMNRFDIAQGIEDLRATTHTMKGHAEANCKVGCLGYCLGGKLAYLMAARTAIDASVGYYGVMIETLLDEAVNIQTPLMLHIAEEDEFVPQEAQQAIKNALAGRENITLHSYPGLNHAFTRIGGKHYDSKGAAIADERTITFLKETLAA